MQIIHKIDPVLRELFPNLKQHDNDHEALIAELKKYYTWGTYQPLVTIKDGYVYINIDIPSIISEERNYVKAIKLCEDHRFNDAIPLLVDLIEKNPTNSEYHRILGQAYSEQGSQDEAINSLIDALKWNPKNTWALLMMGNIFAKYKDDIDTAIRYYDKAVEVEPNNFIALNNIGGSLLSQQKFEAAKKYFIEALAINTDYPNTHYALALIAARDNDFSSAFYSAIQAAKKSDEKDQIHKIALNEAIGYAEQLIQTKSIGNRVSEFKHKLEFEGDKIIEIQADELIPTAAKIEFAENYNRDKHIIRYNPKYKAVEHLIMHCLSPLIDWTNLKNQISHSKLGTHVKNQTTLYT